MQTFPDPRNLALAELDELLLATSYYRDWLMLEKQEKRGMTAAIGSTAFRKEALRQKLGKYKWEEL